MASTNKAEHTSTYIHICMHLRMFSRYVHMHRLMNVAQQCFRTSSPMYTLNHIRSISSFCPMWRRNLLSIRRKMRRSATSMNCKRNGMHTNIAVILLDDTCVCGSSILFHSSRRRIICTCDLVWCVKWLWSASNLSYDEHVVFAETFARIKRSSWRPS